MMSLVSVSPGFCSYPSEHFRILGVFLCFGWEYIYFCPVQFLRGRVQSPTGGDSPRLPFEGLNRWKSGTDGESPDDRRKSGAVQALLCKAFRVPRTIVPGYFLYSTIGFYGMI